MIVMGGSIRKQSKNTGHRVSSTLKLYTNEVLQSMYAELHSTTAAEVVLGRARLNPSETIMHTQIFINRKLVGSFHCKRVPVGESKRR